MHRFSASLKNVTFPLPSLCATLLQAQQTPNFQLLSTADGLSQEWYTTSSKAELTIWIATKDGLNRCDGSRFKVFLARPVQFFFHQ
ncbi:MAG: hypothetical protein IPL27_22705 [Lewinellaceae bacterium]|nr:hypothetical protein [Lewinellaceae bacterium]